MDSFLVEGTLGINDFETTDIQYFYNPISKELNVSSLQLLEGINIYNLLGQNIISEDINASSATFNLSSLDTSIYLITVRGTSGSKSFKLHVN